MLGIRLRRAARRCSTARPVATGRWIRIGPGRRWRAKGSCAGTRGDGKGSAVSLPATRLRVAGTAGGNTRRAILRSLERAASGSAGARAFGGAAAIHPPSRCS